jgi:hypothetical protein
LQRQATPSPPRGLATGGGTRRDYGRHMQRQLPSRTCRS